MSHRLNSPVDPIIAVANATACSGMGPGGTICGGTGSTPFSLTDIENGSAALQAVVGTQTAPVYEATNDTGGTANTVSFSFNLGSGGSFASNQFLTCQVNGAFSGDSCKITTPAGALLANTGQNYGPPVSFPVIYTFSGLGVSAGANFDITFASFGNGDQGLQTGGPIPTPEPASIALFGLGLFGIGFWQKCRSAAGKTA